MHATTNPTRNGKAHPPETVDSLTLTADCGADATLLGQLYRAVTRGGLVTIETRMAGERKGAEYEFFGHMTEVRVGR